MFRTVLAFAKLGRTRKYSATSRIFRKTSINDIDLKEMELSIREIPTRIKKDVKKELEEALKRLPERERTIMVLYYHENMTLKEIGETISISESRVSQLHAQAIMKLKNLLSENRTERLKKSII